MDFNFLQTSYIYSQWYHTIFKCFICISTFKSVKALATYCWKLTCNRFQVGGKVGGENLGVYLISRQHYHNYKVRCRGNTSDLVDYDILCCVEWHLLSGVVLTLFIKSYRITLCHRCLLNNHFKHLTVYISLSFKVISL